MGCCWWACLRLWGLAPGRHCALVYISVPKNHCVCYATSTIDFSVTQLLIVSFFSYTLLELAVSWGWWEFEQVIMYWPVALEDKSWITKVIWPILSQVPAPNLVPIHPADVEIFLWINGKSASLVALKQRSSFSSRKLDSSSGDHGCSCKYFHGNSPTTCWNQVWSNAVKWPKNAILRDIKL